MKIEFYHKLIYQRTIQAEIMEQALTIIHANHHKEYCLFPTLVRLHFRAMLHLWLVPPTKIKQISLNKVTKQ